MGIKSVKKILGLLLGVLLVVSAAGNVNAEMYNSLKGVKDVKVMVDFRNSNAKAAAVHLNLLLKTYNDKSLNAINGKPDFVVVFMGPSVKLISTSRPGGGTEDAKALDAIAGTIAELDKAGVRLEVCVAAAEMLGVDPATFLPGIHPVPNGWISSIGYQLNGYALIPDF